VASAVTRIPQWHFVLALPCVPLEEGRRQPVDVSSVAVHNSYLSVHPYYEVLLTTYSSSCSSEGIKPIAGEYRQDERRTRLIDALVYT
jgi:hypothetical protein